MAPHVPERLWLKSSDVTVGSLKHFSLPTNFCLNQAHPDVALGQALAHVDSSRVVKQEASCRQLALEFILSDQFAFKLLLVMEQGWRENGSLCECCEGSAGSCRGLGVSHQEGLQAFLTSVGSMPPCRQESGTAHSFIISQ